MAITSIQSSNASVIAKSEACNDGCQVGDTTAPPVPQIVSSIACERGTPKASFSWNNNGGFVPGRGKDPAYLEIGNWEPGTTFQMINVSEDPEATFESSAAIVNLAPTGIDVAGRRAAIYLNNDEMSQIGLKAGHHYQLRAIDKEGNVSAAVAGQLAPRNWANGTVTDVVETGGWQSTPGATMSLLDGMARSNFILKTVADTAAPKILDRNVKFTKTGDQLSLAFSKATEPNCGVVVTNSRTGEQFNGAIGADQKLSLPLKGIANGDTLLVAVTDNDGTAAQPLELRYSENCRDGKASSLGILAVRLAGVIG